MLSAIIKKEVEDTFGKEIRYPADCEALSAHISDKTGQSISITTLKRMFGFVNGTHEPRLYTLDVLAQYLGYPNWDVYYEKFIHIENSEFFTAEQIEIDALKPDAVIEIIYDPDRIIRLVYQGNFRFNVEHSTNSKLLRGDQLKIMSIVKHYPLIIASVIRDGKDLGRFVAGKSSGITGICIKS
ncbi:MAG TPA: hypothetical protein PKY63_10820 [Bacteroidales bacterium]|nr:hypothetical protein [Bacteroidales bacterium]